MWEELLQYMTENRVSLFFSALTIVGSVTAGIAAFIVKDHIQQKEQAVKLDNVDEKLENLHNEHIEMKRRQADIEEIARASATHECTYEPDPSTLDKINRLQQDMGSMVSIVNDNKSRIALAEANQAKLDTSLEYMKNIVADTNRMLHTLISEGLKNGKKDS